MKAVIDRFEGNYAIVLLGEEEVQVDIPRKLLPKGSREGSWLIVNFELDPEGEKKQREKVSRLLEKLKSKKGLPRRFKRGNQVVYIKNKLGDMENLSYEEMKVINELAMNLWKIKTTQEEKDM